MKSASLVVVCLVAFSVVSGLAAASLSYSEEDCTVPIIPTGGNDGPHINSIIPTGGNDGPHINSIIPTN